MPDLSYAAGQYMQHKPADEFHSGNSHLFDFIGVFVISPAKCNQPAPVAEDAVIGDCDPVCITPKIRYDLGRALKGRFTVCNPVLAVKKGHKRVKGRRAS